MLRILHKTETLLLLWNIKSSGEYGQTHEERAFWLAGSAVPGTMSVIEYMGSIGIC